MSAEAPLAITRQDIKPLAPATEITPVVPIRPFRMISSSRREAVLDVLSGIVSRTKNISVGLLTGRQESLMAPGLLPMQEAVKDIRGSKRLRPRRGPSRRAACPDCRRVYRIREGHPYCSKKSKSGTPSQKAA